MQLTLVQVAKLFDVSENAVTGWVRDENLPAELVNSQHTSRVSPRIHRDE